MKKLMPDTSHKFVVALAEEVCVLINKRLEEIVPIQRFVTMMRALNLIISSKHGKLCSEILAMEERLSKEK